MAHNQGVDIEDKYIHHKDDNKKNNEPYNLEAMTPRDHKRMHMGTTTIMSANDSINMECPRCGKERFVLLHNLTRSCFTGLCQDCSRKGGAR